MAFFQMNYHSDTLRTGVSVNVIIPEKAKTLIGMNADGASSYKTLYLLHGLSDDHTIWMRRTSIERYASEYGIAVVMPNVARSWYVDSPYGANYFSFVTDELPNVCRNFFRGMSDKREDNLIAGLSMGGYGAMKAALSRPDVFSKCASLSGAFDFTRKERPSLKCEMGAVFGADFKSFSDLKNTKHDVFYLSSNFSYCGFDFPKTYIWCGTEDSLLDTNRDFHNLLNELNISHSYEESEGDHSWKWWDLHIQDALNYLLSED